MKCILKQMRQQRWNHFINSELVVVTIVVCANNGKYFTLGPVLSSVGKKKLYKTLLLLSISSNGKI